jgi:hypothetical protein
VVGPYGGLPASSLLRPGANVGASDVASGGYGGTVYPNYGAYANDLPSVINARLDYNNTFAQTQDQLRSYLQNALIGWGDPNVLSSVGLAGLTGSRFLGQQLSPQTALMARANPLSTVAQLRLAAHNALMNSMNQATAMGGRTGAFGADFARISQADYTNAYNQGLKMTTDANTQINSANLTDAKALTNLQKAYTSGLSTVARDPTAYGVPYPTQTTVGGMVGVPTSALHTFQPPTAPPPGAPPATTGGRGYGGAIGNPPAAPHITATPSPASISPATVLPGPH